MSSSMKPTNLHMGEDKAEQNNLIIALCPDPFVLGYTYEYRTNEEISSHESLLLNS